MFRRKDSLANIFIDLDGPVLDVSDRHYQVYKNIVESLGGTALSKKLYWALRRKNADTGIILFRSSIKSGNKITIFKKEWLNLIEKKYFLNYDKVWPYAQSLLKQISKKYSLILVTLRRFPQNLKWQLGRLDLYDYFDLILCQEANKGNWKAKYKLLKASKLVGRHSCLIGDTEIDILTGKKLQMKTVAVYSGIRGKDVLLKYKPDYILPSLKEAVKVLN